MNVFIIANNIHVNTVGDDSTAARCNSRLITVLVQHNLLTGLTGRGLTKEGMRMI